MIISHSSNLLLGAAVSAACRDGVINDTRMHAYRMWESMTVDPPLNAMLVILQCRDYGFNAHRSWASRQSA